MSSLKSESGSINSKHVLIAFAVVFYSLEYIVADSIADNNFSCYVGEILPDSSGKVDISKVKMQLKIQSCSSPTPTTTQEPSSSPTTANTVPSMTTTTVNTANVTTVNTTIVTPSTVNTTNVTIGNTTIVTPSTVNTANVTTGNTTSGTPSVVSTTIVTPSTVNSSLTPSTVNTTNVTTSTVNNTTVAPSTSLTPAPAQNANNSDAGNYSSPATQVSRTLTQVSSSTSPMSTAPTVTSAPATNTQMRMKRLARDDKNGTCQVTLVRMSNVTTDTSWKAVFQCSDDEADCVNDTSSTNHTYCCRANKCSLPLLMEKEPSIFPTVDSCFTGTTVVASSSCGPRNYVCTNATRTDGTTAYYCGTENITQHCETPGYKGLPQQGCHNVSDSDSDGIAQACCCGSNNCNKQQMMPTTKLITSTSLPYDGKVTTNAVSKHNAVQHSNAALTGGIVGAFFGGLVIGGILIAVYKRKKRGLSARPGELMTFNYKRMSADDYTEEIDLSFT